jgi:hypothetical protein
VAGIWKLIQRLLRALADLFVRRNTMAAPLIFPRFRAFTQAGLPLNGGLLYAYTAGTSTPQNTYTDSTLATPNANPVVLDANGEANVWLGSANYKFVLKDSLSVTQWTVDNVSETGVGTITNFSHAGGGVNTLTASADTKIGASLNVIGDVLGEWSADANARFTPKTAGDFLIRMDGYLGASGANVTIGTNFIATLFVNGVSVGFSFANASWPFATGVQSNLVLYSGSVTVAMTAGSYADVRLTSPAFTGGPMFFSGGLSVRRIS